MKVSAPLLLLALLLAFSSPTRACTPITVEFRTQYESFFLMLRRGVPGRLVRSFYWQYSRSMLLFLKRSFPAHTTPISDLCLSNAELSQFAFFYDYLGPNRSVSFMRFLESDIFYLPEEDYPDSFLMSNQPNLAKFWGHIEDAMAKTLWDVEPYELARVPMALDAFYDPVQAGVCTHFRVHVPDDTGIDAKSLVFEVSAIAVRLHLLGVPTSSISPMLEHLVAFIFNGIRCTRKGGQSLKLSRVFVPIYLSMFDELTAGMDLSAVPVVPTSVVEKRLGKKIDVLSTIRTWGKLMFFGFTGTSLSFELVTDRLFNENGIALVRKDLGLPPVSRQLQMVGRVATGNRSDPLATRAAGRMGTCGAEYFWHSGSSGNVCCPTLCRGAHLLGVSAFSTDSCCGVCRLGSCNTHHPEVRRLTEIVVLPYGEMTARVVMI